MPTGYEYREYKNWRGIPKGVDLFLSRFEKLIAVSQAGQLAMKEMLAAHLRRVEHDEGGLALRLYPFTRKRDDDEPKIIVIDPYVSFGRPAIARRGIATIVVAERYKAGESIALRDAGARVELHDDHFSQDAQDQVWLTEAGERGWIVLTKDKHIRYRAVETNALISIFMDIPGVSRQSALNCKA